MQAGPNAAINFARLDSFVREFQAVGVGELVICLRSASRWGSRHAPRTNYTNLTPKPQYVGHYQRWIGAVVERYDGDGVADMPGLRHPVRYYEIGSEFSSYEPEPVEEYLAMLERAYRAAHGAFPDVQIAHAALLTTTVFANDPGPEEYEAAFATLPERMADHGLADIRRLLDRPDLFDVLNIHSIGAPREIEQIMTWLEWETGQRGYVRPVIISDVATSPMIAWGPATRCGLPERLMGLIVPPAVEADRCRLAAYFTRLVDGDAATVAWTQRYAAADNVQKVVVAAEQGIVLINTAFIEDLIWFKFKFFAAGTGPSAWSGLIDLGRKERRAGWYALRQLMGHLGEYDTIRRVPHPDRTVRVYELREGASRRWIGWVDPDRVVLPGEPIPTVTVELDVGVPRVRMSAMATEAQARDRVEQAPGNRLRWTLGPDPAYVVADR
jgi:hypothetical protein